MENNSVSALEKQLQSRVAEQTATAEKIVSDGYTSLNSKLKKLSATELNTILSDMESQIEAVKTYMKYGWLKTVGLILAVMIGTGAGSWGLTAYMTHRIQSLRVELSDIKAQRQELSLLPVEVYKQNDHQYIIFDAIQKPEFQGTKDGRWAVKVK